MAPRGVKRRRARLAVGVGLFVLLVTSLVQIGFFSPPRGWAFAFGNLALFLSDLTPPDLEAGLLATLGVALVETLQMAYVGTLLGAAAALPIAVAAARPFAPPALAHVARAILAMIRTVPALLWALVFVIMVGLGPLAGMLGIALYTLGYLGKLFYEALEGVDPEITEALRSTGASRTQLVRHALLPEAGNSLISQIVFVFEYNVRASSILGFVGAGGVGFYLFRYLQLFEYRKLATAMILLFVVVLAIEWAGGMARRRFLPDPAPRAT